MLNVSANAPAITLERRNQLGDLLARGSQFLFFTSFPDPETRSRIRDLLGTFWNEQDLRGTAVQPDRLHVTLQPIGLDVGETHLRAVQAGNAIAHPPFPVSMSEAMCLSGRSHPLVLMDEAGTEGFRQLQSALVAAMSAAGFRHIKKDREPHMTLGHLKQPVRSFATGPVRWTAREFALIRCHRGETRYDVLARWDLRG